MPPTEEPNRKEDPIYWSAIHHNNVNSHDIDADVGIPHVIHEKQPLVHEKANDVEYGAATGEKKHKRKWSRVRELVKTDELFVHYIPDGTQAPQDSGSVTSPRAKWSDLNDTAYELTLRECLFATLLLLACGVIAYSFIFENWPILDSLYFTTVILTTVGYGDICPSTRYGKLFASFFALGGIVILGLALGVFGSTLVEAEIEATERMKERSSKAIEKALRVSHRHNEGGGMARQDSSNSLSSLDSIESKDRVSYRSLSNDEFEGAWSKFLEGCGRTWGQVRHHLPGFGPLLIGAFVIARLESWDWVDAVYYCVVTSTTIGFGDLAPTIPVARIFAIFFIPIAVAAMGYILGQLASFIVERRREGYYKRLWSRDLTMEDLEALDTDGDGEVSELEYIRFMLVAMKKVDSSLFDDLHEQFRMLDVVGDGKITKNDLKIMTMRKMRKVHNKLALAIYKSKLQNTTSQRSTGIAAAALAMKAKDSS